MLRPTLLPAAAIAAVGFALGGCQGKPAEPSAQVLNYGVYRVSGVDASQRAGDRLIAQKVEHDRQTDTVEARLGANFGFQFAVRGLPEQQSTTLELRTRHPPIPGPDGTARSESVTALPVYAAKGVHTNVFIYQFDRPEDLKPGPWTLQVLHGGKVLAEQKFTVTISVATQ